MPKKSLKLSFSVIFLSARSNPRMRLHAGGPCGVTWDDVPEQLWLFKLKCCGEVPP